MINATFIHKNTTVEFSRSNEKATVAVHAFYNQLIIRELKDNDKKIGEKLEVTKDENQKKEVKGKEVQLVFHKLESIDAVISLLERVKKNIQLHHEKEEQRNNDYNQAC